MNLNLFFIGFLLLMTNISNSQKKSGQSFFELNGDVKNLSNDNKLFLSYLNDQNQEILDSAVVHNSRFNFKGEIREPREALLSITNEFRMDGKSTVKFYLSPNYMNARCDFSDLSFSEFDNSEAQVDFEKLKKMKLQILDKQDSLFKSRTNFVNLFNNTENVEKRKQIEKKIKSIDEIFNNTIDNEIKVEFDFVQDNLNSYVSIDLLLFRLKGRKGPNHFFQINQLYNSLGKKLKNSTKGNLLNEKLIAFSKNLSGQSVEDFFVIDKNEVYSKFSDIINGKYVLLDFWASWCAPCREDTSYLKKLLNNFHDKGFEIIGFSKDKDKKLWLEAINKDQTDWKHILLQENDKKIEESFFITSIPVKILIDPKGIIIERWRGGGKENEEKLIEKINEIFKNN